MKLPGDISTTASSRVLEVSGVREDLWEFYNSAGNLVVRFAGHPFVLTRAIVCKKRGLNFPILLEFSQDKGGRPEL